MHENITIKRLTAADAPLVVHCFERVYGNTYANPMFYDAQQLAQNLMDNTLRSVGAFFQGQLVGHMAMTHVGTQATSVEMGNTVVDPAVRGGGIAWQVGDELTQWAAELGYTGFLHYPTTDHHIMQQHSVKKGYETGLMLGYIPGHTDGQVRQFSDRAGVEPSSVPLRQAATVVYQPLQPLPSQPAQRHPLFCPSTYRDTLEPLVEASGLHRTWQSTPANGVDITIKFEEQRFPKRGLRRLRVFEGAANLRSVCADFFDSIALLHTPCQHLDLAMQDPDLEHAVEMAKAAGFVFCAWLPGYGATDVLRLQRVAARVTQMQPDVVNPVGKQLLNRIVQEIGV